MVSQILGGVLVLIALGSVHFGSQETAWIKNNRKKDRQ